MAQVLRRDALVVPALGTVYDSLKEYTYPILRIMMGMVFFPHGCQKLFQWWGGRTMDQYVEAFGRMGSWSASPGWVYYIGILECFGGLMMAAGFLTRFVALQFFAFMMIATFVANWPRGYFWTQGGLEAPLVWGAVCFFILAYGGGKWSVDRALGREI
jgi:putative oxidoreductase